MSLIDYFDKTTGMGVLATSDAKGMVNAAVYGRPHFIDEENIAFIMAERLSHKNLQSNPHAATVDMGDIRAFLRAVRGFDFDLMCEIKDKEKSALRIASALKKIRS